MYSRGKTMREGIYRQDTDIPSFSSSLLDEIYRSTCDGATRSPEGRFYRETIHKKQSRNSSGSRLQKTVQEEQMSSHRRACLIEKWMDRKVGEKAGIKQRTYLMDYDHKKSHHDLDAFFFSSTSTSSDSSSGGFSSSDSDSLYGSRSMVPPRPKPVRTTVSGSGRQVIKSNKNKKTERSDPLFYEQRELHLFDDYHYNLNSEENTPKLDGSLISSKSRALKIYSNLKKVKQPISPGGRLASFINSLFTAGNNTKKTKNCSSSSTHSNFYAEMNYPKSGPVSTCSSASSFSRSCLSKNSPSTRGRLRDGEKRSVRFYPVSVIVDEDCRPCGQKCLYEEEKDATLMSVSVPTAWKITKSPSTKTEAETNKFQARERSERVNELARGFLKDYQQKNQKKNDLIKIEDDDDDDAASCCSSDLFELDHLSVMGKDRYSEELPVYETTYLDTNRAIANGFIL